METNNQMNQNNLGNMQNPMNNPLFYGMIQNPMNNPMFCGMMQNQMYNPMFNLMMQNPIYNPMFNGVMPNTNSIPNFNGMMANKMGYGNMINPNNLSTGFPNQINNINTFNHNNNINNIENIPIENSIKLELDNNEIIQYYLYPKIEFSEEESNNSKVLLIIGQTGHGKTTFINALVNIYLGITIYDKFRYLLVKNEDKNKLDSITKEITIYKIRPKKNFIFPPLIIIDTPDLVILEVKKKIN